MSTIDEVMRLQAEVDAAAAGQVRRLFDGSIAYRTTKTREDADAWIILRPDGTTIGAGYITVNELPPLLRWKVLH